MKFRIQQFVQVGLIFVSTLSFAQKISLELPENFKGKKLNSGTSFSINWPAETGVAGSNKRTQAGTCEYDTNCYVTRKMVNMNFIGPLINSPTKTIGAGQYFECPQPMLIRGFSFRALTGSSTGAKVNVQCAVYEAGSDSLYQLNSITGALRTPLGSVNVTVDTTGYGNLNNSKFYTATFTNPISVSKPFIISVLNSSLTVPVYIFTNDYADSSGTPLKPRKQDGNGEYLMKVVLLNSAGKPQPTRSQDLMFSGDRLDADLLVIPFTKPAAFDMTLSVSKDTVYEGEAFKVTHNFPKILTSRMYSIAKLVNRPELSMLWAFGDSSLGKPLMFYYGLDTLTYSYSKAGVYTLTVKDSLYGFGGYLFNGYKTKCTDMKTKTIVVLPKVVNRESSGSPKASVRVYPNPVSGWLSIDLGVRENVTADLTLTSLYGQRIISISSVTGNGITGLDVRNVLPGNYILTVQSATSSTVHKITIK